LKTKNGALVNLLCSRVYGNAVRRAIRPKSNYQLGLAMSAPIAAPSVMTHV